MEQRYDANKKDICDNEKKQWLPDFGSHYWCEPRKILAVNANVVLYYFLIAKVDRVVKGFKVDKVTNDYCQTIPSLLHLHLFNNFFASGAIAHFDDINATSRFAQ